MRNFLDNFAQILILSALTVGILVAVVIVVAIVVIVVLALVHASPHVRFAVHPLSRQASPRWGKLTA